jgi:hypothetical protein
MNQCFLSQPHLKNGSYVSKNAKVVAMWHNWHIYGSFWSFSPVVQYCSWRGRWAECVVLAPGLHGAWFLNFYKLAFWSFNIFGRKILNVYNHDFNPCAKN